MATARKRLTRQESKEQTRRDVLRAAGRLFLRDGFVATSLSAIAEEAGVTKGAVYSNFESKEDLFLTIIQGAETPPARDGLSVSNFDDHLGGPGAPAEGFRQLGRTMAGQAPSARQVALFLEYNAFALRSNRSREWVRRHNAQYFEDMSEQVADAVDADGADVAAIAQSLYVGLLLHRSFDPERFDDALFERAFSLLGQLVEEA